MTVESRCVLLAALLPLVACPNPALERKTQELEKKVSELEARQTEIATWKDLVSTSLDGLQFRLLGLENGDEATVDCAQKGYSFARTQLGMLLVKCEDLRPFGDGYRVALRIGNPHAALLLGVNLSVRYGPRPPEDPKASWAEWTQSLHEKQLKLPDTLRPGAWNRVEIVLAPAKTGDVGFIGVKVEVDRVSMQQ